jgi:diguanylate cyclase (GGDEF)-like protein/PAS domain S-box-containing protein
MPVISPRIILGAGLAFAGVALVEILMAVGIRPLAPIAWPGLGMVAGAAFAGLPGLAGGAAIVAVYYAVSLGTPERFPEFFAQQYNVVAWAVAYTGLSAAALGARWRIERLQQAAIRAATAEAEVLAARKYSEAIRDSETRLRIITDNVPGLVSYIDTEERYRFNNRAYEDWVGLRRSALTGRSIREVWGEELYAQMKPNIERALRGERTSFEYTSTSDGVERHLLANYVPDADDTGKTRGFFVLAIDITQLAATRAELRAARERLENALDGSSAALWDADLRTGRVYLSEAWNSIVEGPGGESVADMKDLGALMHPDDVEPMQRAAVEALKGLRPSYSAEHRVRTAGGEWKWILSRGRVTERDPDTGRALRMIGTNMDITDRKRLEEALQSVVQTDALTGLANRIQLFDRLRLAIARGRRTGEDVALLYIDIDRFKQVNDTRGHAAGDFLLKIFAARLRNCVRSTDTAARIGGDVFVVLLDGIRDGGSANAVAEKIMDAMQEPIQTDGGQVTMSASIGIAFAAGDTDEARLLKRADDALYEAKAAGRNAFRVAR